MTWEYILKADFSFRDVVKNSRGVYAGIFDRIQDTPDLSKLGGAVLGDMIKSLADVEGLTVTDKRKAAEVVLMEPMLLGIDMMNDPSMEEDIDNLRESRITNIKQEEQDDKDAPSNLTDAQMQTFDTLVNAAANKVIPEMKKIITNKLKDKLDEELSGQKIYNLTQELIEVVSSDDFIGYVGVILSALIRRMVKESEDKAKETEPDIDITDDNFSEAFQQANKMDWFSHLKE